VLRGSARPALRGSARPALRGSARPAPLRRRFAARLGQLRRFAARQGQRFAALL